MRAGVLMAVLLLAACAGASPSPASDSVRILATNFQMISEPFTVAVFDTRAAYVAGWQEVDRAGSPPTIDFATTVAIYLGMAGSSSCPETFQHLVVDEEAAHVFGEWDSGQFVGKPCTADLAGQGVVLAVSRSVLPASEFTLTLRETLTCADCPDHPDQVIVSLR